MFSAQESQISRRPDTPRNQFHCVYTTLIGGYEELNEQPIVSSSNLPFICLTDDPDLRSETWDCRWVQPLFPQDPIRSQRELKLRPHIHLPEFASSVYIDNSIVLKKPPEELLRLAGPNFDFCLPLHSFRETLLDEFMEVATLALDDASRIFEQLNHYLLTYPDALGERPFWTGMMVRDHRSDRVRSMLEIWTSHVMRYSRRDQLSVNVAFQTAELRPKSFQLDNFTSDIHTWPHTTGRERHRGTRNVAISLMPAVARARLAEQRLMKYEHDVRDLQARLNSSGASLELRDRQFAEQRTTSGQQLAELRAHYGNQVAELQARAELQERELLRTSSHLQEILNSTTWRIGGPLRWMGTHTPRAFRAGLRGMFRTSRRTFSRMAFAAISIKHTFQTYILPGAGVRARNGAWIYVDPNDGRGRRLIESGGNLNPKTLAAWKLLLSQGSWTHVIDVGANYGEMLVSGGIPENASVVAIEPNPSVRARLRRTIRAVRLKARILKEPVAEQEGPQWLVIDHAWSGTSRLADLGQPGGVEVQATTLGKVLRALGVPLLDVQAAIKIDVEGQEVAVLRGAWPELASLGDAAILTELLHLSPKDRDWLEGRFQVWLLKLEPDTRLELVPPGQLGPMLASGHFYTQDAVLRLRGDVLPLHANRSALT